ncbi:MAG: type IV pilus secretin PilQ [Acidobacteriota bacterium]
MMKPWWSFRRAQVLAPVVVLLGTALTVAETQDPSLTPPAAAIRAVRYNVEPGRTRIWFETSGSVLYTHYSPDPLTLVIDLPGVDISEVSERTVVGSREVESIVATSLEGTNGKSLSRVEIKLGSIVPYQISASEHALSVLLDGSEAPPDTVAEVKPTTDPDQDSARAGEPEAHPEAAETSEAPRESSPPPASEPRLPEPSPIVSESVKIPPPSWPASAIRSLTHVASDELLTVTVQGDGRLNFSSFRLENPKRLVFDFNGVINKVSRAATTIDALGVYRARIAQFRAANPRITRLVFDLDRDVPHRTIEEGSELKILFSQKPGRLAEIDHSMAAMMEGRVVVQQSGLLGSPNRSSRPLVMPSLETWVPAESGAAEGDSPAALEPVAVVAQNVSFGEAPLELTSAPTLPEPPEPLPGPPAPEAPQTEVPAFESQTIGAEQTQYTGELITLDFKDGDIQDIFRLFAEISGLNIVVQPGVSGRITLRLTEVPWDQALELILKTNNLGYVVEGNVIRIAPLSQLADEEAEKRRLAEEKALAGELTTMTRQLSYAKAAELEPLLQRNLSARGDIVIDERTNTLIITDLPDRVQGVDQLIDTLDTAIPGVEIEARILVTTRTFSRNLGIQWGFTGHLDQLFGNSTELTFPNQVLISGQPIGSNVIEEFKGPEDIGGGLLPPQIGADDAQRGYAVNLPFAGTPTGAVGISLGSITGAFSLDAALTVAEKRGQVRIISAPKIITQNNKAAEIKQGVTFPIQTVANNTVTVTFKDAVLLLQVTPQITSAETIILDIVVSNDALDFGLSVQGIPSIVTQSATTQVLVPDGSTTVIGGVFVNRRQEDERFVPLLHRIPILGNLFRSTDTSTRNEELLIFLTPRIRKGLAVGG